MYIKNILTCNLNLQREKRKNVKDNECYLYENGEFKLCNLSDYNVIYDEYLSDFGEMHRLVSYGADFPYTYMSATLPNSKEIPLYVKYFIIKVNDKSSVAGCCMWEGRNIIDNCYLLYENRFVFYPDLETVYIKDEIPGERDHLKSRLMYSINLNDTISVEDLDSEIMDSNLMSYVLDKDSSLDNSKYDILYSLYDVPELDCMVLLFVDYIEKESLTKYSYVYYGFKNKNGEFTNYGEFR